MFSLDGRAVFLGCREHKKTLIKIWRPYLNIDNDDRVITIGEQIVGAGYGHNIINIDFVHDNDNNTMVAITISSRTKKEHKGTLWYIDIDHNRLVQKAELPDRPKRNPFTPDGK